MVTRTTGTAGSQGMLKDDPSGQETPGPAPAAGGRVVILPVNFAVAEKVIIFRTAPDTLLAAYGNAPVSFEADRFDEAHREGWSVLVQGHPVGRAASPRRTALGVHLHRARSGTGAEYLLGQPVQFAERVSADKHDRQPPPGRRNPCTVFPRPPRR